MTARKKKGRGGAAPGPGRDATSAEAMLSANGGSPVQQRSEELTEQIIASLHPNGGVKGDMLGKVSPVALMTGPLLHSGGKARIAEAFVQMAKPLVSELGYCVMKGDVDAVRHLVKNKKANVNRRVDSPPSVTPLTLAFVQGDMAMQRCLLHELHANPTEGLQDGMTMLYWCCRCNYPAEQLQLYIDCEGAAYVNSGDAEGRTPLSWAAENLNLDAVKALLAAGATVTGRPTKGTNRERGYITPLQSAIRHATRAEHAEVVRILAKTMADEGHSIDASGPGGKMTPLLTVLTKEWDGPAPAGSEEAAERSKAMTALVKAIVDSGACVGYASCVGGTPLTPLYAACDRPEVVDIEALKIMVGSGVNVSGYSGVARGIPLHGAARNRHLTALKVLLDAGSRTDIIRGEDGMSVLMEACSRGFVPGVQMLVEAGASINALDYVGRGMREWSAAAHCAELLDLFGPRGKHARDPAGGEKPKYSCYNREWEPRAVRTTPEHVTSPPLPLFCVLDPPSSGPEMAVPDPPVDVAKVEKCLRILLDDGESTYPPVVSGHTGNAFHALAKQSWATPELMELLLAHSSEDLLYEDAGTTGQPLQPFHMALASGSLEVVRWFRHKWLPDWRADPWSLVLAAGNDARGDGINMVTELIDESALGRDGLPDGRDCLVYAMIHDRLRAAQWFLDVVLRGEGKHGTKEIVEAVSRAASRNHGAWLRECLAKGGVVEMVNSFPYNDHHDINSAIDPPLCTAAARGSLEAAEALVKAGVDTETNILGRTPLWLAACNGYPTMVRLLLDHGAEVHAFDHEHVPPFIVAIRHAQHRCAAILLDAAGPLTISSPLIGGGENFKNALRWAATTLAPPGKMLPTWATMDMLMEPWTRVDTDEGSPQFWAATEDGWCRSPLWYAARCGNLRSIILLHAGGMPLDTKDTEKCTPLYIAARYGHVSVVRYLVQNRSVQRNAQCVKKRTALWIAACWGHSSVVQCLLSFDVDCGICDDTSTSPLLAAIMYENPARDYTGVVQMLSTGTNKKQLDLENSQGITPLVAAVRKNNLEIMSILLREGREQLSGDSADVVQMMALQEAAAAGFYEATEMLLRAGAKVNLKSRRARTMSRTFGPLHYAAHAGHIEIVRLLLKWGAQVNECDGMGLTALFKATEMNHSGIVALLLGHGANPLGIAEDATKATAVSGSSQPDHNSVTPMDVGEKLAKKVEDINMDSSQGDPSPFI